MDVGAQWSCVTAQEYQASETPNRIQRLLADLATLCSEENYSIHYPEMLASLPRGREGEVFIVTLLDISRERMLSIFILLEWKYF